MNRSTSIGESGLRAAQVWVDSIAHNIANVNTPGFRSLKTDFGTALASALEQGTLPDLMMGSGVDTGDIILDQRQGSLQATGRMLDVAIEGPGFFVCRDSNGEVSYTRDGTFYIDGSGRLTTSDGSYVLGTGDQILQLGTEPGQVHINGVGQVYREGTEEALGCLKVVTFENPEKLLSAGKQHFQETEASGAPVDLGGDNGQPVHLRQGYRETSNVDLATELTHLIVAERAFQLAARLVQEGDQLDSAAGDLAQ